MSEQPDWMKRESERRALPMPDREAVRMFPHLFDVDPTRRLPCIAYEALADGLAEDVRLVCQGCGTAVGFVAATNHGPVLVLHQAGYEPPRPIDDAMTIGARRLTLPRIAPVTPEGFAVPPWPDVEAQCKRGRQRVSRDDALGWLRDGYGGSHRPAKVFVHICDTKNL